MDTAASASGVAAPEAFSVVRKTGSDEHGATNIATAGTNSSPQRRAAWRQKTATTKSRKIKLPCAEWYFRRLPEDQRSKFEVAPWGRASYADSLERHGQWRVENDAAPDKERQALWRATLAECGGDQARADVVLAARLRAAKAPRREAAPVERSKDWFVHHPGPDLRLVEWLHATRAEFAASFSKSRNAPCEQCGRPVVLGRPRKRVWCSQRCSRAWYNRKRARAKHPAKACRECGTTFQPIRADSIYCSPPCRQSAYRHRGATVVSNIRHTDARTWGSPAVWLPIEATRRMPPLELAA